jgi:hypothetical protein
VLGLKNVVVVCVGGAGGGPGGAGGGGGSRGYAFFTCYPVPKMFKHYLCTVLMVYL